MDIGLAPKNGDLIVLRDAISGAWAIARWAVASDTWVGVDGKPVRLLPTHWEPVAGEAFGKTRSDNWFVVKALVPTVFAATRYPAFKIVFSAAVMLVAIYATSGFRLTDIWPFQAFNLNKVVAAHSDPVAQDKIADLVRNLTQAHAEAKLHLEQTDALQTELRNTVREAEAKQAELAQQLNDSTAAAQAELRETKRAADAKLAELTRQLNNSTTTTQAEVRDATRVAEAKQAELTQRLSDTTAQADKLAQDMTAQLDASRQRAATANREIGQLKQAAAASEANAVASRQALDEMTKRANALEAEITTLHESIAEAAVTRSAAVTGTADATDPVNAAPTATTAKTIEATETTTAAAAPAAAEPTSTASVIPDRADATAGNAAAAPPPASSNATAAVATLEPGATKMPPPSEATPVRTISVADEARLLARAKYLLQQLDFAGARLLLENGIDRGSTQAIALLAATYDEPTIHQLQAYGIKPDPEKARGLYAQAAAFGVEDARRRLEALSTGKH